MLNNMVIYNKLVFDIFKSCTKLYKLVKIKYAYLKLGYKAFKSTIIKVSKWNDKPLNDLIKVLKSGPSVPYFSDKLKKEVIYNI